MMGNTTTTNTDTATAPTIEGAESTTMIKTQGRMMINQTTINEAIVTTEAKTTTINEEIQEIVGTKEQDMIETVQQIEPEEAVTDKVDTQTEALHDTTETTTTTTINDEIHETITLEKLVTAETLETEIVTEEENPTTTEVPIAITETETTVNTPLESIVKLPLKSINASRIPWAKFLTAPTDEEVIKIKEDSRLELIRTHGYLSVNRTAKVVSQLLDDGVLNIMMKVSTSPSNQEFNIEKLLIDGNTHIVNDVIQPLVGKGVITHRNYFDAKYTTELRNGETYKILYTPERIGYILDMVGTDRVDTKIFIKRLVECIVFSKITLQSVEDINKKLVSVGFIKKSNSFISDVLKAQAKAKKTTTASTVTSAQEKRAFEIMKDYALLNNQGKVQIINTTKHGLVTSSISELRNLFANNKVDGAHAVDIWMESEKRPAFVDTKFDPSCIKKDKAYNLFKGFAYPAQKLIDITMFKNFVKDIICNGDDKMYNITWSFLAQMLQDPSRKMGTALVLLSSKGTGKSTFVKVIGELLKGYFYQSADNKRLLGEFNNHLESTLLFYANELTFTGNKRVISKLKNVITEKNFTYEIKGGATYSADNFIRVIIDSNEDMAVVQTADERRFIYPVISEAKIGDTNYFNELHALFAKDGFYESLMYDLMSFDYQPWEDYLKTPPKNEVTEAQVRESFTTIDSWWMYCLEEGKLPNTEYSVSWDGRLSITSENLYQSFRKHTLKNGGRINGIDSGSFITAFKKHILKELDLNISHRPTLDGKRTRFNIYEKLSDQVKHFQRVKRVNHIDYDGEEWEASS